MCTEPRCCRSWSESLGPSTTELFKRCSLHCDYRSNLCTTVVIYMHAADHFKIISSRLFGIEAKRSLRGFTHGTPDYLQFVHCTSSHKACPRCTAIFEHWSRQADALPSPINVHVRFCERIVFMLVEIPHYAGA